MAERFYLEPGPFTVITDHRILVGLPADVGLLREIVSGLVVHPDMLDLYQLAAPDDLSEIHVRPVSELLDIILGKCARPLGEPRPPGKRLLGSCRHYSVLLCAILRSAGTPSRVRSGFARYFEQGTWEDHWLTEYWNPGQARWQRVDAELDEVLSRAYAIAFDPADVPELEFMPGPQAWRSYRDGEVDPQLFGIFASRGPHFIAGTVVRDIAALSKHEMLPWDYWGYLDDLARGTAGLDVTLIDDLADAVIAGDLARILRDYRRPGITVPADLRTVRADR